MLGVGGDKQVAVIAVGVVKEMRGNDPTGAHRLAIFLAFLN
jgi:hypothetical protein